MRRGIGRRCGGYVNRTLTELDHKGRGLKVEVDSPGQQRFALVPHADEQRLLLTVLTPEQEFVSE